MGRFSYLTIDFNSYFASVEQQLNPALRGRPIAVVPVMTDTTSAIAASYEAKAFGVKTGTRIWEAKRMCPGLILVPARHELYVDIHEKLKEEVQNLNKCWERKGLPTVAIRVGLHTGTIVASRIGTRAHWEYTVVGDTVNTAARLQALPRLLTSIQADGSCCILISGATWERLNGAFNGRLLGNVALKGKVQLVPVYQIGAQSPSLRKRTVA